jgi:hypothetical protein
VIIGAIETVSGECQEGLFLDGNIYLRYMDNGAQG